MENKDQQSSKLKVNAEKIKKKLGINLFLFLDAISLGLNDEEIADLIGYDLEKVKKARQYLGDIGSEIGIYYKKDLY